MRPLPCGGNPLSVKLLSFSDMVMCSHTSSAAPA
jgi:hypothetical protein